ncbi:hypothetical protein BDN72DRAFT_840456, partial [Pluteus cervinus]
MREIRSKNTAAASTQRNVRRYGKKLTSTLPNGAIWPSPPLSQTSSQPSSSLSPM